MTVLTLGTYQGETVILFDQGKLRRKALSESHPVEGLKLMEGDLRPRIPRPEELKNERDIPRGEEVLDRLREVFDGRLAALGGAVIGVVVVG